MTNDELDFEVIRPRDQKKKDELAFCSWAAGEWDAKFYAGTETHDRQIEAHLHQLIHNVAWFDWKPKKIDKMAAIRNNKAKGDKRGGRRNRKDS